MELSFKITASLLLLVQAFQSASLQDSTDSPGRTIDKSWLRDLVRNRTGGHVVVIPVEPRQGFDATLDPSHDYSGGITSGSMPTLSEEKENKDGDEEPGDLNVVTTPELPKDLNATISATTLDSTNVTGVEKELHDSSTTSPNSTTFMTAENSTHWSDDNQKDSPTTSAPGVDATQKAAATPAEDLRSINATDPTNARTTKVSQTSASFESATNFLPFTSSEMSPRTTSLQVQDTPEVANKSGTAAGTGSSSERGLDSDFHRNKRRGEWAAILVTAVAVGCVGLVVYVLLKNKQKKGFSHRKLVEEYPTDPVLRLDNGEPLDFDQVAYYNSGLQADNIQMSNIPARY